MDVKAAQSSIEGDAVEWVKKEVRSCKLVRNSPIKGQQQDRAGSADRKRRRWKSGNGRKEPDCGSTGWGPGGTDNG